MPSLRAFFSFSFFYSSVSSTTGSSTSSLAFFLSFPLFFLAASSSSFRLRSSSSAFRLASSSYWILNLSASSSCLFFSAASASNSFLVFFRPLWPLVCTTGVGLAGSSGVSNFSSLRSRPAYSFLKAAISFAKKSYRYYSFKRMFLYDSIWMASRSGAISQFILNNFC